MTSKFVLRFSLGLLITVQFACNVLQTPTEPTEAAAPTELPLITPPTPEPTTPPEATEPPAPTEPLTAEEPTPAQDTEPAQSACEAGKAGESPLYTHQVYRTTGADALNLTAEGELILEHASVPDGVIGSDGAQWVYFVNGEPGQHGIFAAHETASGWEIVDCVRLDGEFVGDAVDPDIVRLEDGRYRLFYFLGHFVTPVDPSQKEHPIYSAISDDGLNFTVEQQVITVEGVTDPSAVQLPDGSWLMAMAQVENNRVVLAASSDGYNFELTDATVDVLGIPELAALPDGRIVLYLSKILISADGGQTWTETGGRVPGGGADPSFVAMPDGTYSFFYKGFSDGPGGPPPGGTPGQPPPGGTPGQPPPPGGTPGQPPPPGGTPGEPLPTPSGDG